MQKFIERLEREGELVRIKVPCNPQLEVAELADRAMKSPKGGKALLLEQTGTPFPILINAFGSEHRMAIALGAETLEGAAEKIAQAIASIKKPMPSLMDKLRALPLLKKVARSMPRRTKRGACQEVILTQVDLSVLPILKTWPLDGGRFVTLPLVHTKDPETGARNVGMYRMQELSKNTTGMHWQLHKTGARHYQQYKKLWLEGKLNTPRMAVAVALGGDPSYTYAATAPLPEGIDEYMLAGFLRDKPVQLVRCVTQDIEVAADADIVLEGYVDVSQDKVVEGPFGDHTGFYSLADDYPVFHITAITHKKNAIYPATLVGPPPMEDRYLALATERLFLPLIQAALAPEVRELYMPWQGVAHNLAVVEIEKSYDGQGFKVASALWGAGQMSFCKYLIITDSIERFKKEWRANPWKLCGEVMRSEGVSDILDHAAPSLGRGGKLCIDTTGRGTRDAGGQDPKEYTIKPLFDLGVEQLNDNEQLWLLLGNSDPGRDCQIIENEIVVDGRSKAGFPNIATMDRATIEQVDRRWAEYGLGDFLESNSKRYLDLKKGDHAQQA